jgi:hypothetical protein
MSISADPGTLPNCSTSTLLAQPTQRVHAVWGRMEILFTAVGPPCRYRARSTARHGDERVPRLLRVVPDPSTLRASSTTPFMHLCRYSLVIKGQAFLRGSCSQRRRRCWTGASSFFPSLIGSLFYSCLYCVFAYTRAFLLTSLSHILALHFWFLLLCAVDYLPFVCSSIFESLVHRPIPYLQYPTRRRIC